MNAYLQQIELHNLIVLVRRGPYFLMLHSAHSRTITHAHRDVDGARQGRKSQEQSALLSPIVQVEEQVKQ